MTEWLLLENHESSRHLLLGSTYLSKKVELDRCQQRPVISRTSFVAYVEDVLVSFYASRQLNFLDASEE